MTNSRTKSSPIARTGWIILTVITLILYLGFVAPLLAYKDGLYTRDLTDNSRAYTGKASNTPLTRARADTIDLQLSLYDALTPLGVGEWTPPPADAPVYQAYRDTWQRCPRGREAEIYDLASAGHFTDRDAAMAAITPNAEAAGDTTPVSNTHHRAHETS